MRDEELFDRYLQGTLSPEEQGELAKRLREDTEFGRRLVEYVTETGLMVRAGMQLEARGALAGSTPADGTEEVAARPPGEEGPGSSARSLAAARRRREREGANWNAWILAAAGVLLACGLYVLLSERPTGNRQAGGRPGPSPEGGGAQRPEAERAQALERVRQAEERRRQAAERLTQMDRERAARERELAEARARTEAKADRQRIEEELAQARKQAEAAREETTREMEGAEAEMRSAQAAAAQLAPKEAALGKVIFLAENAKVTALKGGARATVSVGEELRAGTQVETGVGLELAPTGRTPVVQAVLELANGARVDLAENTRVELADPETLALCRGLLYADVDLKRQGKEGARYVCFRTSHAEIFVTGTRFDLQANTLETRVRMEEGKISFSNAKGSRSITAFQESVAGAGQPPAAPKAFAPQDLWRGRKGQVLSEILLAPSQGRLTGTEWQLVPDADTLTGQTLEALATQSISVAVGAPRAVSWVTYTFQAEAGKDYLVWVRGRATRGVKNPIAHDAVWLEFPEAESVKASGPNQKEMGEKQALINGYMFRDGYVWLSGDADPPGGVEGPGAPLGDLPPLTVRFAKSGKQTLRLAAKETPIRIDSIWISETQKERPTWGPEAPARTRK